MKSFFLKNWFAISLSIILIYRILIAFSFKPELINGETNNIWSAINFVSGKSLYTNPEELPLEIFQYTPLSQLPIIFFAKKLPEKSPYYVYSIWVLGRLLQIVYNLIVVFILYKILNTCFNLSKNYIQLFIILFFGSLTHASFSVRPDSLQMLLVTSVFCLFVVGYFKNKIKYLNLSALLIGLAVLAKQDGFFILFPLIGFLFIKFEWKKLIQFGIISISSIIMFISIFSLLFGEYFLVSVTKGISNQPLFSQVIVTFNKLVNLYFIQLVGFIIALFFCIKQRLYLDERIQLLLITISCYFLFGIITSSKIGSWVNYYTLFLMFAFLFTFMILDLIDLELKSYLFYFQFIVSITLVVFLYRQIFHYLSPFLKNKENKTYYLERYEEYQLVKKKFKIDKKDNVMSMNYLQRNFFGANSIMVNIEYYAISKFNYSKFIKQKNKSIKYIIKNKKELPIVQNLCRFFNVDTTKYETSFENENIEVLTLRN